MSEEEKTVYGLVAEFNNPADLLTAAVKVRNAGYKAFDCHSPFPVHGMDEAMGLKRSPLGWMVGIMSFTGLALAYLLQGWTSAIDYPLNIAGKPFFSYQAYVPVGFGFAVLFGALTAFFGMMALNKLPQPWHPVFYSDSFEKMTTDGFYVSIESTDEKFDAEKTADFMSEIGAERVELLKGE